jgi:glycosyltransferase involved in cell wall biosynthesis
MPMTAIAPPPDRAETVAFLADCFPVLSETFIGTEIRAVERAGRRVEVIAFRRPDQPFQPVDEALARRTTYLDRGCRPALSANPVRWTRAWRFACAQTGLSRQSLMMNGARIAKILIDRRVDHLHAHFAWGSAAHAIVAARLAGIGVSFVGHGSDVFQTPTDLAAKLIHADLAVATCEDTRAHFLEIAPDARVVTVPCGIDPSRFGAGRPEAMPSRRLVFVSRLIERKGLRETLEALARVPRALRPALDVVGDGPERAALVERAKALDLDDVRFLGSRPAEWLAANLPPYLALIAPFFEGADGGRDTGPLVAKEALVSGVPVIASSFMGLKEIVTPACGLLVPPRDVPALARAIEKAATWTEEHRAALGEAGRRRVLSRFTDRHQADGLTRAFDAVHGER